MLWAAVFLTASVIYRPVEQLLLEDDRRAQARVAIAGAALRVAATIQLGLAAVFALVALVLKGPIREDLLRGARRSTGAWSGP